jgi:hypothetical protein
VALLALCLLAADARGSAAQSQSGGIKLDVTEVAQSVDLSRGRERFITVTVDVSGAPAARLRRIQPLREDFELLAGKRTLPCRWLRGGSSPEDAGRLRFTLGFSLPPKGTHKVTLRANLPRLEGDDILELNLAELPLSAPVQPRSGKGWSITVGRFERQDYTPPSLPPKGQFTVKSIPADTRVFRKPTTGPVPEQALVLSLTSRTADLYDPTLDVSGWLTVEKGQPAPLLSALMRRVPSRAATESDMPPFVTGEFHFTVPPAGRVTGAVLRFHRRPANPEPQRFVIPDLPVPGS